MAQIIIIGLISAFAAGIVSAYLTKNKARFQKYQKDAAKQAAEEEKKDTSGIDVTIDL
jgi:sortase (surface protein transpeptidase)